MAQVQRVGDIEINEDLQFQERMWDAQRVVWVVFALILLATLLGLLGRGLLSHTSVGAEGDPLWIEYERFGRLQASVSFTVHVDTAPDSETVRVWLDRSYMEGVEVEEVVPTPQSVEIASDRLFYVFQVADPGSSIDVRFELTPTDFGWLEGRVGLDGGESLSFGQLIYP